MYSLNRASIIGNLTRDPELRQTSTGTNVASFAVATNRKWTGSDGQAAEETEFHNVVAWGKLAEICSEYLKKGAKVYIEGRLKTRSWESENGHKNYRTEVIAENMIMLQRKDGDSAFSAPLPTEPPEMQVQAIKADDSPKKEAEAKDDESKPEGNKADSEEGEKISVEDLPF